MQEQTPLVLEELRPVEPVELEDTVGVAAEDAVASEEPAVDTEDMVDSIPNSAPVPAVVETVTTSRAVAVVAEENSRALEWIVVAVEVAEDNPNPLIEVDDTVVVAASGKVAEEVAVVTVEELAVAEGTLDVAASAVAADIPTDQYLDSTPVAVFVVAADSTADFDPFYSPPSSKLLTPSTCPSTSTPTLLEHDSSTVSLPRPIIPLSSIPTLLLFEWMHVIWLIPILLLFGIWFRHPRLLPILLRFPGHR
jgi:hypothetical protein